MAYTIKDILRLEVAPALGCTEPAAVALGAAAAASLLPGRGADGVELQVSPNIFKNGLAVAIPGAQGASGMELAAALGVFGGDPKQGLEALAGLTDEALAEARAFVRGRGVKVRVLKGKAPIVVRVKLARAGRTAEAEIRDLHDNITALCVDGKPLRRHPLLSTTGRRETEVHQAEAWLAKRNLDEILALIDGLDEDDYAFLRQGVEYNLKLAEYGLTYGPGLGVGLAMERLVREGLLKKDMVSAARILTSAAADARMSGARLPAMSSAGSGNHGLTAVLPIWAVRDYVVDADETLVLKAIALSHVVTASVKAHTGRLTAVCGCSIAAGAGATAGITFLLGGTARHIAGAVKNVVGDLAGVICDGAKAGCALKLSTAAGNAVLSSLLALHGLAVGPMDGIVGASHEETVRNLGELSTQGMIEADRTILGIMIKKQFDQD